MSLTIALHTGRKDAKWEWFFDSLRHQKGLKRVTQIIIVDFYAQACDEWTQEDVMERGRQLVAAAKEFEPIIRISPPMPTIWQGPFRITKENHWAASNMRNTSFALCKNPWIAMLDDRCVLAPDWLTSIKQAMASKFAIFGSYSKHHNLVVKDGLVKDFGTTTGEDNRLAIAGGRRVKVNGAWGYGCTFALPLEWALKVNGFPVLCDGLSMEDICFSMLLHNNGLRMFYEPAMRVYQDRTPSELDRPFKRSDKGVSPMDKSHAALTVIGGKKRSEGPNLREIRDKALWGIPFPVPTEENPKDWYDNSEIRGL